MSGNGDAASGERRADTIGKQLADIKGKGVATLKRAAEASEGRIVMRQTDSGSRLLSTFDGAHLGASSSGLGAAVKPQTSRYRPARASSQAPAKEAGEDDSASADCRMIARSMMTGADDSISVATTTSDVNSDDDAASIASRLSQIVVEEEERLFSSDQRNQMLIIDNSSGNISDEANRRKPSSSGSTHGGSANARLSGAMSRRPGSADSCSPMGPSLIKNNQLRPGTSRARSTRSNSVAEQHLQGNQTGSGRASTGVIQLAASSGKLLPDGKLVPEIHLIKDEDQRQAKMRTGEERRQVAGDGRSGTNKSREVSKFGQNERQYSPNRRRDSSSGFLPERGDLKSLETSRANQRDHFAAPDDSSHKLTVRMRSNTFGSVAKVGLPEIGGQLNSNIRRSAWTLSEFDQTFNKSGDKSLGSDRQSLTDISCKPPTVVSQSQDKFKQIPDENLFVKVIQKKQQASMSESITANGCVSMASICPQISSAARLSVDFGAANSDRRASYDHSIISMASTIDSYCDNRPSIIGSSKLSKRLERKKKSRRADETEGDANFNDASRQQPGEGDKFAEPGCLKSCFSIAILEQYVPIIRWLPAYKLGFLWGDLMAGLAVAVLNISTSLSAAVVAETDFSVAFRASIVNTFVYAVLCSSRHTSFGSWSIMSQMLFVSVRRALSDELILARINLGPSADWDAEEYERWHLNIIVMYTFLIGLVQLVCGLLNLGKILASFIPEALCSSMITATAFTMAIGQLSNMCGTSNKILWSIEKNSTSLWADLKNPPISITDLFSGLFRWIQQIALLVKYHEQINLISVIISIISVFLLILNQYVIQKQLEHFFRRKIFIPSELILLVIMIIVSSSLNLKENYKVATCGPLTIDFVVPDWPNLRLIRELWFDSFATALISFTMVYVMAKTYSNKFNYEVDCNQELIACGAGNLIGGLCDALPATASFSRTAGQVEAGGQTQMASLINCVGLFVMARVLGHHVAELPVCVMAATLFYGFARMMARFPEIFIYWRVCKVDFAIWVVTFVAILTLDIVNGFIYGFIFSILTMLYRAQNRRCYMLGSIGTPEVFVPLVKYPLAQEIEGIKIFQFCGPIHYVCADLFEQLLRQKTRVDVKQIHRDIAERNLDKFNPRDMNLPSHIILDFSMISYVDSSGIHVIKKIIDDFQQVNITILLASLASHVATVVKKEPSLWNVYKQRFYVTLADAVHVALHDGRSQTRIDPSGKDVEEHE